MKSPAAPLVAVLLSYSPFAAAVGFDWKGRKYIPAGYADGTTSGIPDQYGFGFGALERSVLHKSIFYGGSERGFVSISDFSKYPDVTIAPFGITLEYGLTDLKACGDLLFVSMKDDPNPGTLAVYSTATRNDDGSLNAPILLQSITVGFGPDNILVSKDCNTVVTANEGEGVYSDEDGFVNPEGSISIIRGPFDAAATAIARGPSDAAATATTVTLDKWTEQELLDMNVHLPLSLNAMKYWSSNSSGIDVNFAEAISVYTPAAALEPEYLAWGKDETKIYVNLQENNALVIVDVATNMAESIHAYGLKDWSTTPIDIVEDGECVLNTQEGLYSLRSADSIASITVDGEDYIITANEGDDVEYGDFEERLKSKAIFVGTTLGFPGMTADTAIFSDSSITQGTSRFFNKQCDDTNAETPFCSGSMRFTVGSAMIDYSDYETPNIYRLTAIGGRGVSIFHVNSTGLELVWDSADDLEKEGCAAFPWAHNSIVDEEFAPVNGAFYNSLAVNDSLRTTIEEVNDPTMDGCEDGGDGNPGACPLGLLVDERSLKDGPAAEAVVVGQACDATFMVTVSEKNSIGFLYDISVMTKPTLEKVFHLSPASETLNPGLAYESRTLGEIDSETIQFLSESDSPTGKAAVIFSGAWSGTVSLWEFDCGANAAPPTTSAASMYAIGGWMATMTGFLMSILF